MDGDTDSVAASDSLGTENGCCMLPLHVTFVLPEAKYEFLPLPLLCASATSGRGCTK